MPKNKFSSSTLFTFLFFFPFLFFSFPPLSAQTLPPENPYFIEINVQSQSLQGTSQEQNTFLQQGFKELILKLTGSEKVLENPEVKQALSHVDDYVKQFNFTSKEKERYLRIQFLEPLILELLNKIQAPILGQYRQKIVLWLVISDSNTPGNTPEWINAETKPEIFSEIQKTAKRYGVPILFPLFDLEDTTHLSIQNILNNEVESILKASERYHSQSILIGKLTKQEQWHADWTMISNQNKDQIQNWQSQESSINLVFSHFIENLLPKISSNEKINDDLEVAVQTPIKPKTAHFQLMVSGINDVKQYASVLAYLRKLPEVINVDVLEMSSSQTTFTLETTLEEKAMIQNLNKDNSLIERVVESVETENPLHLYKIKG